MIGLALSFGSLRRRFGDETARMLMLLFSATPLINVLLTWIGHGDPLTVALPMLLMPLPSPVLRLPVSFLLAIAHFEQGVVIVALICALQPFIDADQTARR